MDFMVSFIKHFKIIIQTNAFSIITMQRYGRKLAWCLIICLQQLSQKVEFLLSMEDYHHLLAIQIIYENLRELWKYLLMDHFQVKIKLDNFQIFYGQTPMSQKRVFGLSVLEVRDIYLTDKQQWRYLFKIKIFSLIGSMVQSLYAEPISQ